MQPIAIYWIIAWRIVAVAGLILTVLSFGLYLYLYRSNRVSRLQDSAELSQALECWMPFVKGEVGTRRDWKRFENRARFLASDQHFVPAHEHRDEIFGLVGFVAIEEAGGIKDSAVNIDFQQWKQGPLWRSLKLKLSTECARIIDNSCQDDWNRFRYLATGKFYMSTETARLLD